MSRLVFHVLSVTVAHAFSRANLALGVRRLTVVSKAQIRNNGLDQTRVFVSGLPLTVDWQDLKDHCRESIGEVVYASVSKYPDGKSKGTGLVQFETTEAAEQAILTLRNFPFQGQTLFVRPDVQDRAKRANPTSDEAKSSRAPSPPSKWQRCEDDKFDVSNEALELIQGYIADRENLKRRREFDKADAIRNALQKKGIKVDDGTKRWWIQDGVPASIRSAKGEGNWASPAQASRQKNAPWVCIEGAGEVESVEEVEKLLELRETKRGERDFAAADRIYEDLKRRGVVVNDNFKTWRVWADESGLRPMTNPLE